MNTPRPQILEQQVAGCCEFGRQWDLFWFSPRLPHTLAIIRIATGFLMAYSHLIWCLRLSDFMGPNALITKELSRRLHQDDFAWSYLWYIDSMPFLWIHQIVAIVVCLAFGLGLLTRLTVPLGWLMTLMVCHRMTGFLFGFDQVIMMLSMYLMLAPCGSVWSIDSWLNERLVGTTTSDKSQSTPQVNSQRSILQWLLPSAHPSSMTTVATRLIQLHLCVVYLFGGISKLRGEMWWDGSAMWFSAVAYEYQSLDLTWIGNFPLLAATVTHATLFWEVFYVAAVWPKWTRPLVLMMAVMVHGGIALFLGMITFGFMMIVANFAFVEPLWLLGAWNWLVPHGESSKATS